MKLLDLERHLRAHGCLLAREGSRHSIWQNSANGKVAPVPRHRGETKHSPIHRSPVGNPRTMIRSLFAFGATLASALFLDAPAHAHPVLADPPDYPFVPGFDRFFA